MIVFNNGEYDILASKEPKHYRWEGDQLLAYNSWIRCDREAFDALIEKYLAADRAE